MMFPRWFRLSALIPAILVVLTLPVPTRAFTACRRATATASAVATCTPCRHFSPAAIQVVKKKNTKEDLSFIESRDMTREEMLELNKKNEEIMNMELQAMTGFSLILSLPILYLCWVAFFSD
jgi:hypothetical protein